MKQYWKWIGVGILIILIFFVIATLLEFGNLGLLKYKLGLKRQAIKSSLQYSESKISLLWQLYEEYQTAEEAHKKVLLNRMKVEVSRLDKSQVPIEILTLIARR